MARKKPIGWKGEPGRHSLSARGILSGRRSRTDGTHPMRLTVEWRRAVGGKWATQIFKVGDVYYQASVSKRGPELYYWAVYEMHSLTGVPFFIDEENVSSTRLAKESAREVLLGAIEKAEQIKRVPAVLAG